MPPFVRVIDLPITHHKHVAAHFSTAFSAPSAIVTAGMGLGAQWGAELTEFLIVLNSPNAVRSFMSGGKLTIGGNLSIAVGPLGRNGEAWKSLDKGQIVSMYSYSRTKGLFSGISLESSVIGEPLQHNVINEAADVDELTAARADANAIAYQRDVTPKELLSGDIAPPQWADALIQTLTRTVGDFNHDNDALSDTSERLSISGTSTEQQSQSINSAPTRWPQGDFYRGHKDTASSGGGSEKMTACGEGFDQKSIDLDSRREGSSSQSDPVLPAPGSQEPGGSRRGVSENQWKKPPSQEKQEILDSTRLSRHPSNRPVPPRPGSHPSNSRATPPPSIEPPHRSSSSVVGGCVSNAPRPSESPIPKAQTIPEAGPDVTSSFASNSLVERRDEHPPWTDSDHLNLTPFAQPPLDSKTGSAEVQGSSPKPADKWDGESDLSESESVGSSPGRIHKLPVKRL
ncbi:hypothetical protein FRC01_004258 [Tulasnella sp. 417]|nr:hypothetical protein FRC01_004258 [Tulasnella sp. 417]